MGVAHIPLVARLPELAGAALAAAAAVQNRAHPGGARTPLRTAAGPPAELQPLLLSSAYGLDLKKKKKVHHIVGCRHALGLKMSKLVKHLKSFDGFGFHSTPIFGVLDLQSWIHAALCSHLQITSLCSHE